MGENMNNISKMIVKAIYQNLWLKIEYRNTKKDITNFMIGINDINPHKKSIKCDSFNVVYKYESEERMIYYDSILSCEICENTYHKTPDSLLIKLEDSQEEFIFLQDDFTKDDIIDYYCDCFKLDTVPYVSKYGLVPGIDNDTLMKGPVYSLNEEQFHIMANNHFYQNKKKKSDGVEKLENQLVLNIISIKTNKGLYVLAYKTLRLDIKKKILVPDDTITVSKEFNLSSGSSKIEQIESAYKYLPEEDYYLLDDIDHHIQDVIDSIHKYNHTRTSSYAKEVKTDNNPYIVNLGKCYIVDIDKELTGIKDMLNHPEEMTLPIRTFFGHPDSKLARRLNYPIFTVDDKYNIDQINAIHIAMKSPVSYIQGPPGTGKTKTLLNAIVTAVFNDKTVLVTSNNNVPMDGIYDDILSLKYHTGTPLLFPAIRLGSFSNVDIALERIKQMYKISCGLKPQEYTIHQIKSNRKFAMLKLTELLNNYDYYTHLKEKEVAIQKLLEENTNDMFAITLSAQLEKVKQELIETGEISLEDFNNYMSIDFKSFFMAIHFETASRLQKLNKPKYAPILEIIQMPSETQKERDERTKIFRSYLSEDENLTLFQDIFPVVISTNLSCTYLGNPHQQFDIVMMDEAGQCNIANALIPISRGKQLMLVGDPQQLKPVIVMDSNVNQKLKKIYHIPQDYDYVENSIYTTYTKIDVINNETLLSYHYRCHPQIIGFSNQKYYHNKLKLMSSSQEKAPLVFVDTSKEETSNPSYMKNVSDIEAQYICEYIKSNPDKNVGIITPFVRQKECIEKYLRDNQIEETAIGTVHAFQGDQKDVIIFSTAITNATHQATYNWLKCNRELINVAVSRAKDKLIMIGNKSAIYNLSTDQDDLKELVEYVNSNGKSEITDVSIASSALGTRQISTESEKDLSQTVNHILSVINNNCYIRTEQSLSSIFQDDGVDSPIFYKQRFDLIIFEKQFQGDRPILAIELNGPEHYTDEEVKIRDQKKKEFCDRHHLKLLSIPRDCARDYTNIKHTLMDCIKVVK